MTIPDWDLIHSFLAVAEQGSLSAAARRLGVSQPTLSRDIQALEAATGLQLFQRTPQGLAPTEAGLSLLEAAGAMGEAALRFSRQAAGLSEELHGTVRISANDIVGVYLLPPALTAFRQHHPGVQVEVVISNETSNLHKREADLALRMYRPAQLDLIARRLPDLALGFYAHRDYLAAHDEPHDFAEFMQHPIIGMDQAQDWIKGGKQLGYTFTPEHFALRTDSLLTQIALLRSGAGIGGTHVGLAQRWPELVRIMEWIPLPPLEFWLVCHHDMQYNARVHTLLSFLGEWFGSDPYARALH